MRSCRVLNIESRDLTDAQQRHAVKEGFDVFARVPLHRSHTDKQKDVIV